MIYVCKTVFGLCYLCVGAGLDSTAGNKNIEDVIANSTPGFYVLNGELVFRTRTSLFSFVKSLAVVFFDLPRCLLLPKSLLNQNMFLRVF